MLTGSLMTPREGPKVGIVEDFIDDACGDSGRTRGWCLEPGTYRQDEDTTVLYTVFLGLATWGYLEWRRTLAAQR